VIYGNKMNDEDLQLARILFNINYKVQFQYFCECLAEVKKGKSRDKI